MKLTIFTDELKLDLADGIKTLKDWGFRWLDLRGRIFGKHFEKLDDAERARLRRLLDDHGMKIACLESSLAKVHLPDSARLAAEQEKLEQIIRAADALDCRLVRAFHYWQPAAGPDRGQLAVQPDKLQIVLDMFGPLAERARKAGLTLAFENCGVSLDEVFALLDALPDRDWGLAWDCANAWTANQVPNRDLYARCLARTRVVHVKAVGIVPGLHPAAVPWREILSDLSAQGFAGPVSIETHNPDKSVSDVDMCRRVLDGLTPLVPHAAPQVSVGASFEPVRFVIVGMGMGKSRARQMKNTPGTTLAGVVDRDEARARAAGEELGVEWTTDLAPWLRRSDVDAVFVVTPTGLHAEPSLAALDAGKHVLVTKPMEANLAACDRMIAAADKARRLLAVDFEFRLNPSVQRARQRLMRGDLGRLLGGTASLKIRRTAEYFQASGGWRGTRKLDGGGVMSNQNIHHIDELVYILGLPAKVSMRAWRQMHSIEAEDLAIATWQYAEGAVVQIYATTVFPVDSWYVSLDLHGADGALVRRQGGPYTCPVERWFVGRKWEESAPEMELLPWRSSAQNFAAAIRTGAPLVCDGRDGRRSRQVLDAMYRSAEQDGVWVNVE